MGVVVTYVVTAVVVVWAGSLAQGLHFENTYRKVDNPTDWNRVVAPFNGTYVISVTVDPDYNALKTKELELNINNKPMFSGYAWRVMSSAAMACQLTANDVITVTAEVSDDLDDRLTVAYVDSESYYYASRSEGVPTLAAGENMPFDEVWNFPGGWTPSSHDYIQVEWTGVYWVMARINRLVLRESIMAINVLKPGSSELKGVCTIKITHPVAFPLSCSGAYSLSAGSKVTLNSRTNGLTPVMNTILSLAYLKNNDNMVATGRLKLPAESQCRRAKSDEVGYLEMVGITRRHTQSAGHGLEDNGHNNLHLAAARTGHDVTADATRTRQTPGDTYDDSVFFWFGMDTNLGGMTHRARNTLIIQTPGVYLVGMRPEPVRGTYGDARHMGFLHYKDDQVLWRANGESSSWSFEAQDVLVIYTKGDCKLPYEIFVSVALVTAL